MKNSISSATRIRRGIWVLSFLGTMVTSVAQEGTAGSSARPPVPVQQSPVDFFRKLLTATAAERSQLLSGRSNEHQNQFRAFILEYEKLSPEERELRLQTLELRFQLTSLLRLPVAMRTQQVARLPETSRELLKSRLEYWNQLTPDVQKAILENERLMRVLTWVLAGRQASGSTSASPSASEMGKVEAAVLNWNSLPESKRAAAETAFRRMFELGSIEVVQVTRLPAAEREEMQRVLDRFTTLSPTQRSVCIRNFAKLAEMTPEARRAFLQSAEEWQKMTLSDRQAWKDLVKRVPVLPPFPPGFRMPPMPSKVGQPVPAMQASTNDSTNELPAGVIPSR